LAIEKVLVYHLLIPYLQQLLSLRTHALGIPLCGLSFGFFGLEEGTCKLILSFSRRPEVGAESAIVAMLFPGLGHTDGCRERASALACLRPWPGDVQYQTEIAAGAPAILPADHRAP
jgi:hypothetical protein